MKIVTKQVIVDKQRYKLFACEIMQNEMKQSLLETPHEVDVTYVSTELHRLGGEKMRWRLQNMIDEVDTANYDALLMGYGLCNNGISGLKCQIPMVIPRAHDCITLFMGSMDRYKSYHNEFSGSYYMSPGWVDHSEGGELTDQHAMAMDELGMQKNYEEYINLYGEENGKYLWEMLGDGTVHYDNFTYVDTDIPNQKDYVTYVKEEAKKKGWAYRKYKGNRNLLTRLVCGQWSSNEFLVVLPGESIKPSYDDSVIRSHKVSED